MVVGSVGGLDEIENRILTPAIRSIVRNVAGASIRVQDRNPDGTPVQPATYTVRPTKVLDLIENRDALEQTIEQQIKVEGNKAGVDIREIRLGEPAIPPELLVSRLRVQLADQLSTAYERETDAQQKRIETEQARSTADEQPRLVEAQIAVQVANQREQERAALGRAERQYLEELAAASVRRSMCSARTGSPSCRPWKSCFPRWNANLNWWALSASSCRTRWLAETVVSPERPPCSAPASARHSKAAQPGRQATSRNAA